MVMVKLLLSSTLRGVNTCILVSIVLDIPYDYVKDVDCDGKALQEYTSLQAAIDACLDNRECTMVTDFSCDNDKWTTCIGDVNNAGVGSCSWIKGMIVNLRH